LVAGEQCLIAQAIDFGQLLTQSDIATELWPLAIAEHDTIRTLRRSLSALAPIFALRLSIATLGAADARIWLARDARRGPRLAILGIGLRGPRPATLPLPLCEGRVGSQQ
jgi:hypothetical protein